MYKIMSQKANLVRTKAGGLSPRIQKGSKTAGSPKGSKVRLSNNYVTADEQEEDGSQPPPTKEYSYFSPKSYRGPDRSGVFEFDPEDIIDFSRSTRQELQLKIMELQEEINSFKSAVKTEISLRKKVERKNSELQLALEESRRGLQETKDAMLKVQQSTDDMFRKRDQKDVQIQELIATNNNLESKVAELEARGFSTHSDDVVRLQTLVTATKKTVQQKEEAVQSLEEQILELHSQTRKGDRDIRKVQEEKRDLEYLLDATEKRALAAESNFKILEMQLRSKIEQLEREVKLVNAAHDNSLNSNTLNSKYQTSMELLSQKISEFSDGKRSLEQRLGGIEDFLQGSMRLTEEKKLLEERVRALQEDLRKATEEKWEAVNRYKSQVSKTAAAEERVQAVATATAAAIDAIAARSVEKHGEGLEAIKRALDDRLSTFRSVDIEHKEGLVAIVSQLEGTLGEQVRAMDARVREESTRLSSSVMSSLQVERSILLERVSQLEKAVIDSRTELVDSNKAAANAIGNDVQSLVSEYHATIEERMNAVQQGVHVIQLNQEQERLVVRPTTDAIREIIEQTIHGAAAETTRDTTALFSANIAVLDKSAADKHSKSMLLLQNLSDSLAHLAGLTEEETRLAVEDRARQAEAMTLLQSQCKSLAEAAVKGAADSSASAPSLPTDNRSGDNSQQDKGKEDPSFTERLLFDKMRTLEQMMLATHHFQQQQQQQQQHHHHHQQLTFPDNEGVGNPFVHPQIHAAHLAINSQGAALSPVSAPTTQRPPFDHNNPHSYNPKRNIPPLDMQSALAGNYSMGSPYVAAGATANTTTTLGQHFAESKNVSHLIPQVNSGSSFLPVIESAFPAPSVAPLSHLKHVQSNSISLRAEASDVTLAKHNSISNGQSPLAIGVNGQAWPATERAENGGFDTRNEKRSSASMPSSLDPASVRTIIKREAPCSEQQLQQQEKQPKQLQPEQHTQLLGRGGDQQSQSPQHQLLMRELTLSPQQPKQQVQQQQQQQQQLHEQQQTISMSPSPQQPQASKPQYSSPRASSMRQSHTSTPNGSTAHHVIKSYEHSHDNSSHGNSGGGGRTENGNTSNQNTQLSSHGKSVATGAAGGGGGGGSNARVMSSPRLSRKSSSSNSSSGINSPATSFAFITATDLEGIPEHSGGEEEDSLYPGPPIPTIDDNNNNNNASAAVSVPSLSDHLGRRSGADRATAANRTVRASGDGDGSNSGKSRGAAGGDVQTSGVLLPAGHADAPLVMDSTARRVQRSNSSSSNTPHGGGGGSGTSGSRVESGGGKTSASKEAQSPRPTRSREGSKREAASSSLSSSSASASELLVDRHGRADARTRFDKAKSVSAKKTGAGANNASMGNSAVEQQASKLKRHSSERIQDTATSTILHDMSIDVGEGDSGSDGGFDRSRRAAFLQDSQSISPDNFSSARIDALRDEISDLYTQSKEHKRRIVHFGNVFLDENGRKPSKEDRRLYAKDLYLSYHRCARELKKKKSLLARFDPGSDDKSNNSNSKGSDLAFTSSGRFRLAGNSQKSVGSLSSDFTDDDYGDFDDLRDD